MNKVLSPSVVVALLLIFGAPVAAGTFVDRVDFGVRGRDANVLQQFASGTARFHEAAEGSPGPMKNRFIDANHASDLLPTRAGRQHTRGPLDGTASFFWGSALRRQTKSSWVAASDVGLRSPADAIGPYFVRRVATDIFKDIGPTNTKDYVDTVQIPVGPPNDRSPVLNAAQDAPRIVANDRNEDGGLGAAKAAYDITWKPIRIGAGGWVTGIDIVRDGTTVVRTDTYGAYLWDPVADRWAQLVNANSMPTDDVSVDKNSGVYEIRIAPSDSRRLYMMYRGYIYRSEDKGAHWTRTSFPKVSDAANDTYRMCGQKMAVDPVNPDVVYAGTPARGLWKTSNGGTSWTQVSAVPESGSGAGVTGIGFDTTSAKRDGKTSTIFASSWGKGVYRSVDAGESWTLLSGGPNNVNHGKIAADGGYYAAGDDSSKIWRFLGGKWTDITPASDHWGGIVVDPFDAAHIVAIRSGGYLDISHDRGATWGGIIWGDAAHPNKRVAADVPWLGWTNETYMSEGDMLYDPTTPNKLWFAEGIGVWYANVPADTLWSTGITWNSRNAGIEQLVAYTIISPPGGKPLVGSGDRPVFYIDNPDVYPSVHGPDNENAIISGFALDYSATAPNFVAGIFNWPGKERSAYSTDGGRTWKQFVSKPADAVEGRIGGCIAVSTPSNIVWVAGNNGNPYYTKDGGATWLQISLPGVPTSGTTGWIFAYFLDRHIVAADRAKSGTFYLYNYLKGLYRSSDEGDSWTLVKRGQIAPWSGFNAKLKSVPGRSGHLFFTAGQLGNPGDPKPNPAGSFMRSTDGGTRWTPIPNVREVYDFGFGKAATSDGYPTIYIAGWVNREYGVWESDNQGDSWTQIGKWPTGSLDYVKAVQGDMNIYGRVYVGFSGSGYAYGDRANGQPRRP